MNATQKKTDPTAVAALTLILLLGLITACNKKGGSEEKRPPTPSYEITKADYGTFGELTTPYSPRFNTSFTVDDCQNVRVDLYNTEGDVVAHILDSTFCRGGWRVVPKIMWKIERDEEKGIADTVLIPLNDLESGIYYFSITTSAGEKKHKSVHMQKL